MHGSTHARLRRQQRPEEFGIGTGDQRSVDRFIGLSSAKLNVIGACEGSGANGAAVVTGAKAAINHPKSHSKPCNVIVRVDSPRCRRTEIETLPLQGAARQYGQEHWAPGL